MLRKTNLQQLPKVYVNNNPKMTNAPNVGKVHGIIDNNVQQKILSVISAARLDTMVHSAKCYSKNMPEITEDQTEPDENSFLGAIHSNSSKQWLWKISLNQTQVTFKLDTGVTAISKETFSYLQSIILTKPSKVLIGQANSHLSITGQFTEILSHKDIQCWHEIFVIKNLKTTLLGLPAITELQLVERLHNVSFSTSPDGVGESFPNLFSGLGTLIDEYKIKVCSNSKPYALHTALYNYLYQYHCCLENHFFPVKAFLIHWWLTMVNSILQQSFVSFQSHMISNK